jgi:hypothetical protein
MEREREGTPESNDRETREAQSLHGPAEELTVPVAAESELNDAVADLDAAPVKALPMAEPANLEAAQASPPADESEPRRRRSTVREPAPTASAGEAPQPAQPPPSPPAPQPVITEVGEGESTDRPRRSGWWSKRLAGG